MSDVFLALVEDNFTNLLPEPSTIFKLDVYSDNQIMSSLWDIFIFNTTQYQNTNVTCNKWQWKP